MHACVELLCLGFEKFVNMLLFLLQRNTFQVVLGAQSDGFRSFALFLYPDIQWGGEQVQIGFSSGAILFFMLPAARSPAVVNIDDGSNVGTPGLYVFRVDTTLVVKPGG